MTQEDRMDRPTPDVPPRARTAGLVVKELSDEVLVYDLERHRAHSLNGLAAAVWRRCDSIRDPTAIVAALPGTDGTPTPVETVRYALRELTRVGRVMGSEVEANVTRRELVRRIGTAATTLPLVTPIVAPTAAEAQSPCPVPQGTCSPSLCATVPHSSAGVTHASPRFVARIRSAAPPPGTVLASRKSHRCAWRAPPRARRSQFGSVNIDKLREVRPRWS